METIYMTRDRLGFNCLVLLFRETNVMVLWAPDLLLVSHATHIQDCHLRPQWALVLWREVASATKRSVSHTHIGIALRGRFVLQRNFPKLRGHFGT